MAPPLAEEDNGSLSIMTKGKYDTALFPDQHPS